MNWAFERWPSNNYLSCCSLGRKGGDHVDYPETPLPFVLYKLCYSISMPFDNLSVLCTLVCCWPGNPTLMSSLFPNRDPQSSFSEIPEFRFYSQLVTIYCSSRNVHIYYIYIHFCGGASIWSVESTEGPYVKPGNRAFVTESESRKTFLMKTSRKAPPHWVRLAESGVPGSFFLSSFVLNFNSFSFLHCRSWRR